MELANAKRTEAEITEMTLDAALDLALIWLKWNDAAQAYRVLAIWCRAHDRDPRFVASMEVRDRRGPGASAMLARAHAQRRTPEMLDVLGADWNDAWP